MTNSQDNLEIWVKISTQIGELNGFIKTALEKLADHERRLDNLEKNRTNGDNTSLKSEIIVWLVKGIVAAIFVIGSITGSSALLKGIFENERYTIQGNTERCDRTGGGISQTIR